MPITTSIQCLPTQNSEEAEIENSGEPMIDRNYFLRNRSVLVTGVFLVSVVPLLNEKTGKTALQRLLIPKNLQGIYEYQDPIISPPSD
jgi:hypothetical protein